MLLINGPDEPHTYYSRAWQKISCEDITIATDDVAKITVEQQLKEVTTNQYSLSSSRICDRQVENCAQAGTTKQQTGQNFVKKKKKKKSR